jgi:hypothetical protein
MDRNHNKKMKSVFEIIGSYVTDIMFNHIFNSAKTSASKHSSITDEYKRKVQVYMMGVKTEEKCYQTVIVNMHKYFTSMTRHTTMDFNDFVNLITSQLMPKEYYSFLNTSNKDELLNSSVTELISNISGYVTSPEILRKIIDFHDSQHKITIQMIKDRCVDILITKRETVYNQFLKKIGQSKDTELGGSTIRLKNALDKTLKEKEKLKSENVKLLSRLEESLQKEEKYVRLIRLIKLSTEKSYSDDKTCEDQSNDGNRTPEDEILPDQAKILELVEKSEDEKFEDKILPDQAKILELVGKSEDEKESEGEKSEDEKESEGEKSEHEESESEKSEDNIIVNFKSNIETINSQSNILKLVEKTE